jgi:hypothetical protein
MLGGSVGFKQKTILYMFIRWKSTLFRMSRAAKMSSTLKSIQIQTLALRMRHKWKEIIDFECKATNGKS